MNKPSQLTQSLIGDRRPIRKVLEGQKALVTGANSGSAPPSHWHSDKLAPTSS